MIIKLAFIEIKKNIVELQLKVIIQAVIITVTAMINVFCG